jgi:DNA-binding transcriptional LysR family regulator
MDIDRLYAFIDAAQTLNFSETAHHLHVSQPTVSKYIQDLERLLGVRLFDRNGAGLRLTEAGQTILPWARRLVRECGKLGRSWPTADRLHHGSRQVYFATTGGALSPPPSTRAV